MNGHAFTLCGAALVARPSGALWWPAARLLAVADLHLGKAERLARRGGPLLPPYETADTLARLAAEVDALAPATVLCLGDSFDDPDAALGLAESAGRDLARLAAGRLWVWIAGNHDPGPPGPGATHRGMWREGPLAFRHIALPEAAGEVSGHYHPKARIGGLSRPCFVIDAGRVILPAFGTYTGGLSADAPALAALVRPPARAVMTGGGGIVLPLVPAAPPCP
ncbi:MAG: ligase-associated DNA damage response endonuclease PdeM [Rhodobacteraceae bacterium]|jgi:DNA ligase-associated metallophosphoesterase|nr:ligase-associated DNA damage response endonuclease PdeM [Paracoccaceae bacterium]